MGDVDTKTEDVAIWDDARTKSVGVVTDGSGVNRLAIDVGAGLTLLEAGKIYSYATSVTMATNGVNNPLIFLKNPSGNTKSIYFREAWMGIDVANVFARYGFFVNPTTTANGTAKTPSNRLIGGAASSMQIFEIPTVTANGTLFSYYEVGQNTNSIGALETVGIKIPANNTLLITGDPSSNSRAAVITLIWAEY